MSIAPPEQVVEAGLVYVTDRAPGLTRIRSGKHFGYRTPDGKPIRDRKTLQRIRSLAIPPAYEHVWICPLPEGHLQATGIDARGRKQYRYHPRFREVRDSAKFEHLVEFARALPKVRKRIDRDLRKPGLAREKVLAAIVYLLERSLIRVGNDEYARENHSVGLTTMENRHVVVHGATLQFRFVGKSGVRHDIELHDRRLARVVRALQELPGQELFQFVGEDDTLHSVTSHEVNAYLKEITGGDFTAKDFRTWAGTLLAFAELSQVELPSTATGQKRAVSQVIKRVARQLGNTPAVCRKCYIHPAVLETFSAGGTQSQLRDCSRMHEGMEAVECAVLALLESPTSLKRAS